MENLIRKIEPKNMGEVRIEVDEFIDLYNDSKAEFVDVRADFETKVWGFNFGLKIPVNELPDHLDELPKDKLIVVACPNVDRSNMARTYLSLQGYKSKYLIGGLLNLTTVLRGGGTKKIKL